MIFVPWVIFAAGVIWLIRWGTKSKAEYLRGQINAQERAKIKPIEELMLAAIKGQSGSEQGKPGPIGPFVAPSQEERFTGYGTSVRSSR